MSERDRARRYREPLLHAAFNLQSRIWNICQQQFLNEFLVNGSDRDRQYARSNTAYLFAQYLYWAELVRLEAQGLTPGRRRRERKLLAAMEEVRYILADSQGLNELPFRIFRGDQRAIGEIMARPDADYERPEHTCRGYADFLHVLAANASFASWLQPLLRDIDVVAADTGKRRRLIQVQRELVKLLERIDKRGRVVPKKGSKSRQLVPV